MRAKLQCASLALVLTLSANSYADALETRILPTWNPIFGASGRQMEALRERLRLYTESLVATTTQKPDPEQLKKLLDYYQLTEEDQADFDAMAAALAKLNPFQWQQLFQESLNQGIQLFISGISPSLEEAPKPRIAARAEITDALRGALAQKHSDDLGDFVKTANGVLYAKHVSNPIASGDQRTPVLLGGGFPFNQTQFGDFNAKLSHVAELDLYDPVCTGLSVLYDAVEDQGRGCTPYKAEPLQLYKEEIAIRLARQFTAQFAPFLGMSADDYANALFRITRLSYQGVSLAQQAHSLAALTGLRGYREGESILTGLSYGGLLAAKAGAMYPGLFKAVVLFAPGVENPAHLKKVRDLSALLERNTVHRRVLKRMVRDMAYSPRYDAYRPEVLQAHDKAFRDSLITKMLGEMDMDLRADLARVRDRVYMVIGGQDSAVGAKNQIDAMREVFKKPKGMGSLIIAPQGGHALWGNPAQAAEDAVVRSLDEIVKGREGTFQDGGVYLWNEATRSFDTLGHGMEGLAKADAYIDQIGPKAPNGAGGTGGTK